MKSEQQFTDDESVSGRSGRSRRCRGQHAGEAERAGIAAAAAVRQLLAGLRTVAATGTGRVLASSVCPKAGKR